MVDYQQLMAKLGNLEKPRFQSRFMVKTGVRIRVIQTDQMDQLKKGLIKISTKEICTFFKYYP